MAAQLPAPPPETLKLLRARAGLTQAEVAEAQEYVCSKRRYEDLEQGKARNCTAAVVDGIARKLGVTRKRLYEGHMVGRSRLPTTGPNLFGRENQIRALDTAWATTEYEVDSTQVNVISLVGWGGVGKSSIVNEWLARMAKDGYRGARRGFCWSFYRPRGTDQVSASAEAFIDEALREFGDPAPQSGLPEEKGERLAQLVGKQRTLLILDGIEPIQHPPGRHGGELADDGLRACLRELAINNAGLCVLTTRYAVADLDIFRESTGPVIHDMERLPRSASIELLQSFGAVGTQKDMDAVCGEFGDHALSLTLVGTYLRDAVQPTGDVRKLMSFSLLDQDKHQRGHAERIMQLYERWFEGRPELAILNLVGLFDAPADAELVMMLRSRPQLAALSDLFVEMTDADWHRAVNNLRRARLLSEPADDDDHTLDAHPLIREYFGERLQKANRVAWRAGNTLLFEYLTSRHSIPQQPDTLVALLPLFAAVTHACRAGLHQRAFDEVYRPRILRGNEYYAWKVLGAYRFCFRALTEFFERPWDKPVSALSVEAKGEVLSEAGQHLRGMGDLEAATIPCEASFKLMKEHKDWKAATIDAGNLSELCVLAGKIDAAIAYARESVRLAGSIKEDDKLLWRIISRTWVGDARLQAGDLKKAEAVFREAENIQAKREPKRPLLYSIQGYQFCDLLLDKIEKQVYDARTVGHTPRDAFAHVLAVRKRARQTLKWNEQRCVPAWIAMNHFVLARVALLEQVLSGRAQSGDNGAWKHIEEGLRNGRKSGEDEFIARILILKSKVLRHQQYSGRGDATTCLEEAERISERGKMKLLMCDCLLERVRCALASGESAKAATHMNIAEQIIAECGYYRRNTEVHQLQQMM